MQKKQDKNKFLIRKNNIKGFQLMWIKYQIFWKNR